MPARFESAQQLATFLSTCTNDLAAPAAELMPDIVAMRRELAQTQGCLLTRLSGSGPTCFGLYSDEGGARAAAIQVASNQPSWWVVPTALLQG